MPSWGPAAAGHRSVEPVRLSGTFGRCRVCTFVGHSPESRERSMIVNSSSISTTRRPNVAVVPAYCSETKRLFGIRLEERSPGVWTADWAFPLSERRCSREGYSRQELRGEFSLAVEYPGCPHCEKETFALCGCGRLSCCHAEAASHTCPSCGWHFQLEDPINRLTAENDL